MAPSSQGTVSSPHLASRAGPAAVPPYYQKGKDLGLRNWGCFCVGAAGTKGARGAHTPVTT